MLNMAPINQKQPENLYMATWNTVTLRPSSQSIY